MQIDAHLEVGLECRWRLGDGAPEDAAQLLALLAAIERTGSIAAGARELGLSYRNAWGRIERWQRALGQSLLDAGRGSGSRLSPFAGRLLEIDAQLRRRVEPHLAAAREEMRRVLESGAGGGAVRVTVVASHDLALARLRDRMAAAGHEVALQFRGSMESLSALAQGSCDVAGFHLPEGEAGARLWPAYRRLLHPQRHAVLNLCRRTQGLIVQRGNPKRLRSIADLARRDVRFLNRQRGAGTRLLLDELLRQGGIDPGSIVGYATEEHTHAAVAALVAEGEADAGLGIEAAARHFGLDFVPLVTEDYFLAVRRDRLREPPVAALTEFLRSPAFRAEVEALGGYEAGQAGDEVALQDVPAAADPGRTTVRRPRGKQ